MTLALTLPLLAICAAPGGGSQAGEFPGVSSAPRTSTEQDERHIRNLEVRRRRKVGFAGSADVLSFRSRGQGVDNEMVKEQLTLNINKII